MIDPAEHGLAGKVTLHFSDQHADFFTRNQIVVVAEHDLGPRFRRYVAQTVVHREVLADSPQLRDVIERILLRRLTPWLDPDRNPMPHFVPFPRLARLMAAPVWARVPFRRAPWANGTRLWWRTRRADRWMRRLR